MLDPTKYKRVKYNNNPLREVICQLRFPDILRLESEAPVEFQERISPTYPLFERTEGFEISIANPVSGQPPSLRKSVTYQFIDAGETWSVSCTPTFIALVSKEYPGWDEFRERVSRLFEAFVASYKVTTIVRTGLRYRNIIDEKNTGTKNPKWKEFVSPKIGGFLTSNILDENEVLQTNSTTHFKRENVEITIQQGTVTDTLSKDKGYILDFDIFTNARYAPTRELVEEHISRCHDFAGPIFRESITDELHVRLGPQELD